ncbi:unnamed protein product [Peronospora belbahrii]|uniref:Uncharacterized protein n=1 Tax=Peronospora belbahrii TaxID=622444 RepID=A0AAU9KYD7_9STRA|nr:unnamed protein product [Peronospora belbahrii]
MPIHAAERQRQCDRSLGQIPLSSNEIELYSRQDEVTRRRRILLAVRDEERRLAQHMTKCYRNNLQKLQRQRVYKAQKQWKLQNQHSVEGRYDSKLNVLERTGTSSPQTKKLVEKVVKWKQEHPKVIQKEDETMKYRNKMDEKEDRFIVEGRQEVRRERGRKALNQLVSRRQGQQAMEWLALMDRMERRAREQRSGEDDLMDAELNKSEQTAERAFAQLLGLDEEGSVDLSVFSINSDDKPFFALADSDHEFRWDGAEAERADLDGRTSEPTATKHSDFVKLREGPEFGGLVKGAKDKQAERTCGQPLTTTTSGKMQRVELDKLKKLKDVCKSCPRLRGVRSGYHELSDDGSLQTPLSQWNGRTDKGGYVALTSMGRPHYDCNTSERPEGNKEEIDSSAQCSLQSFIQESPTRKQELGSVVVAQPLAESGQCLSSNSLPNPSVAEGFYKKTCFGDDYVGAADKEQRSYSKSSSTSNNKKVSHLDVVGNNSTSIARLQKVGDKPVKLNSSAEYLSGASSTATSIENVESKLLVDSTEHQLYDVRANHSAPHESNISPKSLDGDEVDARVLERTPDIGKKRLFTPSVEETATDHLVPRYASATEPVDASLIEGAEFLSPDLYASRDDDNGKFCKKGRVFDSTSYRDVSINKDGWLSMFDSFSASSWESLSHLAEMDNDREGSPEQHCVDQYTMYCSKSEGFSEYERDAEAEYQGPPVGFNRAHSSVHFSDPRGSYCQRIWYKARRSSTSAVSVAQYSLPSSDTQSSFDESFDRLDLGQDDSFVNELVPMFPKHNLTSSPQSFDKDNETVEEYNIRFVEPNMRRMLTSAQCLSCEKSGQRLVYEKHQVAKTDHSQRQVLANYSSSELGATSFNTSVKRLPAQQPEVDGQNRQLETVAAGSNSSRRFGNSPQTSDHKEQDAMSEISSEASVSSLGSTAQLNIAVDATRRRNAGDKARVTSSSADGLHNLSAQEYPSDDKMDKQQNASEQSFASSSSMSMDINFDHHIKKTSAVEQSLPLQLWLPAMTYEEKNTNVLPAPMTNRVKNMTVPPAPMTWSASSVSSISSSRSIPCSDQDVSVSLAEEQHARWFKTMNHLARDCDLQHSSHVSFQSENCNVSRVAGCTRRTRSEKAARRFTFADSKRFITQLPPSSPSLRNRSQSPAPKRNQRDSDIDQGEGEVSLAEAFQQHHSGFGQRVNNQHDKIKPQQDKLNKSSRQQQSQFEEESMPIKHDSVQCDAAPITRSRGTTGLFFRRSTAAGSGRRK